MEAIEILLYAGIGLSGLSVILLLVAALLWVTLPPKDTLLPDVAPEPKPPKPPKPAKEPKAPKPPKEPKKKLEPAPAPVPVVVTVETEQPPMQPVPDAIQETSPAEPAPLVAEAALEETPATPAVERVAPEEAPAQEKPIAATTAPPSFQVAERAEDAPPVPEAEEKKREKKIRAKKQKRRKDVTATKVVAILDEPVDLIAEITKRQRMAEGLPDSWNGYGMEGTILIVDKPKSESA